MREKEEETNAHSFRRRYANIFLLFDVLQGKKFPFSFLLLPHVHRAKIINSFSSESRRLLKEPSVIQ